MPKQDGYIQVKTKDLRDASMGALEKTGVPRDQAEIISESLVLADQRGVYTHGCVCLPRYIGLMNAGEMKKAAEYKTLRQTDVLEVWDGERSSGQVLGNWAMNKAMQIARVHGVGMVAVRGANHFGAAAYYSLLAQRAGMIGVSMSTGSSTMAPWGGADRLIGNNPLAVAIPAREHPPVVLDMAQSVVAFGRISNIRKQGKTLLPEGWALDQDGNPTTDANDAFTVLPMAKHKGFGSALVIDVLAGILFGGATGDRAGDDREGPSCLFMAFDPKAFGDEDAFYRAMDARIDELKASRPAPGSKGVMMPGEIEEINMRDSREDIWMMPEIVDDLMKLPR